MDVADLGAIPMQPESLLTPTQLAGRIDDGGLRLPSVLGGGGGGGSGPSISPAPPIPGVPQPDTWVLMVSGFGFIGLALRRPRKGATRKA